MLYDEINKDIISAMKSKEKENVTILRMLKSDIDLYKLNNKLDSITDEIVITVLSKQVKSHNDSISQFEAAGRMDLVDKEKAEVKILSKYLPEQLSEEEIKKEVETIITKLEATSRKDMGKVMKELNVSLKGKADFKIVSKYVNEQLN